MPGVHRVEPLGLTFSLLDVEPEQSGRDRRAPRARRVAVLGGGVLVALGVALGLRSRPAGALPAPPVGTAAAVVDPAVVVDPALPAGVVYAAALLLADGARLVSWSFGVPSPAGRVPLPGVGVLLAVSLLAAVAGTLWLAAVALAGQGTPAAGRTALWLAVSTGGAGLVLAVVRVAVQPETTLAMAQPVAGIALALALVAFALRGWPAWLLPAAVAVSALAAVAACSHRPRRGGELRRERGDGRRRDRAARSRGARADRPRAGAPAGVPGRARGAARSPGLRSSAAAPRAPDGLPRRWRPPDSAASAAEGEAVGERARQPGVEDLPLRALDRGTGRGRSSTVRVSLSNIAKEASGLPSRGWPIEPGFTR